MAESDPSGTLGRSAFGTLANWLDSRSLSVAWQMPFPFLMLIPFAAFACCVLGQFYLMRQVRSILANKHPEVWRELSSKSFFIDNAIFSFIFKKRYRPLADPDLTGVADRMRKLQFLAIGIWLIYMVMMFTTFGANP